MALCGGPGEQLRALEVVDQRQHVRRGQNLYLPRPGRLVTLGGRADQAPIAGRGVDRGRQNTGNTRQAAVQRQFAQCGVLVQNIAGNHAHGRQEAQRDGQIEMTAFLGEVCGREIDSDPLGREGQAQSLQGRADPFAGFAHGLVRQADDGEGGQPGAHLHLDVHIDHIHALEGDRIDVCDHDPPVCDPFGRRLYRVSTGRRTKKERMASISKVCR